MKVTFTESDLELFSAASHDRNPLHCSPVYARKTHYGQPVVFGILGALAVLSRIKAPEGHRLAKLNLEFPRPIFSGLEYQVASGVEAAAKSTASLMDGTTRLVKLDLEFVPGSPAPLRLDPPAHAPLPEARRLDDADLTPGMEVSGEYQPDPQPTAALLRRFDIDPQPWCSLLIPSLLWSSYLAGMELPGERALFYRLALQFAEGPIGSGPLGWRARMRSKNALNLLQSDVRLGVGDQTVAQGEIGVLLRPPAVKGSAQVLPQADDLKGTTALVIGASRGLGAAITRALALRGAAVLANFHQSAEEAAALQRELDGVVLCQGDAADLEWCRQTLRAYPRIDFLILNACPTVLPLRVEAETIGRINDYVARAFALVSTPLSVFCGATAQRIVLISSSYVETVPKEFPQYVAVKSAVEGLVRAAAQQHRQAAYLIVRPPKLLTDMTNTPYGSKDGIAPETIAASIASRLSAEAVPGTVDLL